MSESRADELFRVRGEFKTSDDFRWKFKKFAAFSNFQQMFYFSSGRFGFPAGKFIFPEIF
jgi:hypothetical protein